MSYEDRVMSQLVGIRNHVALLGHRLHVGERIDPLTMIGELEAIQRRCDRALLTPKDEAPTPPPTEAQASRLRLVRNEEQA